MPFAWTAIHLIDVITGASAAELPSQHEKDQSSNKDSSGRKVSLNAQPTSYVTGVISFHHERSSCDLFLPLGMNSTYLLTDLLQKGQNDLYKKMHVLLYLFCKTLGLLAFRLGLVFRDRVHLSL